MQPFLFRRRKGSKPKPAEFIQSEAIDCSELAIQGTCVCDADVQHHRFFRENILAE